MPEETKESKAQKLAAARKKLKEFQKRGGAHHDIAAAAVSTERIASPALSQEHQYSTGSISSNLSERSESELNLNGNGNGNGVRPADNENVTPTVEMAAVSENVVATQANDTINTAASYFNALPQQSMPSFTTVLATEPNETLAIEQHFIPSMPGQHITDIQSANLNAMQVLITEKAQLNSEVNKCRTLCRERDLELEELRTQYTGATQRLEELQQRYLAQQQGSENLRHTYIELQNKLAKVTATLEDQAMHVEELKKHLDVVEARAIKAEQEYKEKSNELEMSQIRIRQLSDETNVSTDNRVETLTQTQFMYEQQIRDLQAMVQQLTQDKEQANVQYQNYVQHLNTEVNNLNERNAELMDECTKLQERERQLIDHISGLERDIQKNISRQDLLKAAEKEKEQNKETNENVEALTTEIARLNEKINDYEFERHEFQLKIKSQEERLEQLTTDTQVKENELEQIKEHLEHINEEQPDKVKLLATMESDKVAASRALTQNVAMKKQLDELEIRFVELTNDKAELMNKLDAEEYANREMRTNYTAMEERLHNIDERFKYKDEEMIRLSHENMDLLRKNAILERQVGRLVHSEVQGDNDKYADNEESDEHEHKHDHHHHHENDHDHHEHEHDHHDHDNDHEHEHHEHEHDHHKHDHDHHHHHHDQDEHKNDNKKSADECDSAKTETDSCQEASEEQAQDLTTTTTTINQQPAHHNDHDHHHKHEHAAKMCAGHNTAHVMPTEEAVEKLQQRFTHLMSQVADLTDDKQRLEHLVLQLQGETETIGEYITLYQTQRRILKQREYEKAAQTKLLQEERAQMRDKITMLNNLVSSLGVELPQNVQLQQHFNAAFAESAATAQGDANNDAVPQAANHERQQHQQQQQILAVSPLSEKLKSTESQQILTKIQDIITEIKENTTKEVPAVPLHTADHLNCCMGKFEVV